MNIIQADYHNVIQAQAIIRLLDQYARSTMGGEEPLSDYSKKYLIEHLASLTNAFSILVYDNDEAIGLVNCFYGFSTFKCQPLVNIHDVYVNDQYRGMGISQQMLQKVEQIAKENGCCKLTLEVLQGNYAAQQAYKRFGFEGYQLGDKLGDALFWQKELC